MYKSFPAMCATGLAVCLTANTALAVERPWREVVAERQADREVLRGDHTLAADPDLVRAGVYPTLEDSLAAGATATRFAEVDVDRDGRLDALLVVTPSRDPYPYNRAPGLVVAHAVNRGWMSTVIVRRWQSEEAAEPSADCSSWFAPVVGARETVLVLRDERYVSHDPHDYFDVTYVFLRVDREGGVWWLGHMSDSWWQPDHCEPRRFRMVRDRVLRGEGMRSVSVRLEARAEPIDGDGCSR
jgi:hypothetical protein